MKKMTLHQEHGFLQKGIWYKPGKKKKKSFKMDAHLVYM